ncbi:hypothetical protein A3F06_02430 [candidate division TM6 bacterium RIFCSPHIGHO2_12_FULL_36_22]|nr:MAG: hypothetical protein A3F06_02430 [candidate division TM6 bacterium RIFCSPHIGHO2_12_FULL_36_22]
MENIGWGKLGKKLTIENDLMERDVWVNKGILCGIDEVGRGCLAGPVVAAAVILDPGSNHPLLKDSKQMDEQERLLAYDWIVQHAIFGLGLVDSQHIDRYNIHKATQLSMKRALSQVMVQASQNISLILVDAVRLQFASNDYKSIPFKAFPYAESRSISVAAASIIAKVTRDRIMDTIKVSIPGYGMEQHKGYGTQTHAIALVKHGPSIIHRLSFIKKLYNQVVTHHEKQRELFG